MSQIEAPESCRWVIADTKVVKGDRWSDVEHWVRIEPSTCEDYLFPKVGQSVTLAPNHVIPGL